MTAQDFPARPTVAVGNTTTRPEWLLDNDCLPWNHFVSAAATFDLMSGTLGAAKLYNSAWYFSLLSWTTTNAGEVGWDIYVAAGSWRMEWYRDKRGDYGIVQYKVDGTNVGSTFDKYAATRVRTVDHISAMTLARGWHRFSSYVTGKNASSTGYLNVVSGLALVRVS